MLSVLFRPFPWEAGNAQALVAAAEGGRCSMAIFVVLAAAASCGCPGSSVRTPYVAFALAYTALFVLAFSSIGNFGLLTRQRTQVLPFVLVLLAVPARALVSELAPGRARSVTRTPKRLRSEQLAAERAVP